MRDVPGKGCQFLDAVELQSWQRGERGCTGGRGSLYAQRVPVHTGRRFRPQQGKSFATDFRESLDGAVYFDRVSPGYRMDKSRRGLEEPAPALWTVELGSL